MPHHERALHWAPERHLIATALRRVARGPQSRSLPKSANLLAHVRFLWDLVTVRFGWAPAGDDGSYQRRRYRAYGAYLKHQSRKLPRLNLDEYDRLYRNALRERLAALPAAWKGTRVLCLGARVGTEVKAFIDLGAFAIGIDINPGPGNRYVVHGDFHHLQYPDDTVDVVFSNSLDHVYDLDRWLAEVRRVLRPEGILLLEVGNGLQEGGRPEFYESLCWTSVDEVIGDLAGRGFGLLSDRPFAYPAGGRQLVLRRSG